MFPFLRTPYNYDMNAAGDESGIDCQFATVLDEDTGELVRVATPSLAKQSFAEECDINTIVKRFGISGQLPTNVRMPTYGDFEGVRDYQQALNAVRQAAESFMEMPADVRARFQNDPGRFVDFCSDETNREEAVKLGLVVPKAAALVASGAGQAAPVASPAPGKGPETPEAPKAA